MTITAIAVLRPRSAIRMLPPAGCLPHLQHGRQVHSPIVMRPALRGPLPFAAAILVTVRTLTVTMMALGVNLTGDAGKGLRPNNSFKPRSLRGRGVVWQIVTTPRPQSAPA